MKSKQKFHKKIYTSFSPTIPEENIDKKLVKNKYKLYIRHSNNQNHLLPNVITNQSNKDSDSIYSKENNNKKIKTLQEDDYSPSVYSNNNLFNKSNKDFYQNKSFSQKIKINKKYNFSLNNNNINLNKSFDLLIPNFFIEYFDIKNSKEFLFQKLIDLFSKLKTKNNNNLLYINNDKNLIENGMIEIPKSKFSRKNKTLKSNKIIRLTDQNIKTTKQNYVFYESIDTTNFQRHTKTLTDSNGLFFSDTENEAKTINNQTVNNLYFSPHDKKIRSEKINTKNSVIKNTLIKKSIADDLKEESASSISERYHKNNNNGINRTMKYLNNNNFLNNIINNNKIFLKESVVKESHNHIEFNSINSSSNRKGIVKNFKTSQEQPKFCFKKRILLEEEYIVNDKGEQKLICVKRLKPSNTTININNRNIINNNDLNNNIAYTTNGLQVIDCAKQLYRKENNFIDNIPHFNYRAKNNTQKNFYSKCLNNSKSMIYDKINLKENMIINKNLNRVQSTNNYFPNKRKNSNIIIMNEDNMNNISVLKDQKFTNSFKNINNNGKQLRYKSMNKTNFVLRDPVMLCNDLSERNKNNIRLRKFTNLNPLIDITECSNNMQNNLLNNYYNGKFQKKNHNFHEIKSISRDNRHQQFSNEIAYINKNNVLYESKKNYNSINDEDNRNKKIVYVNRCNNKNNYENELKRNFTDKYYNSQLIFSQRALSKKTTSSEYNIPTTSSTQYGFTYID